MTARAFSHSGAWLPRWAWIILALVALAGGLVLARLPLMWAAIVLTSLILVVAAFIYPLVGLGATLFFGPFKPLTDYFVPELPLDIGQIALLVTLGAWLLHFLANRRKGIPGSPLALPLLVFVGAASLSLLNALSLGFALKELIKWVQLMLVMWLVIDAAGERRWPAVIGMILAAAVFQALVGVWQFGLRGDGPEHFLILDDRFYRAYGTFEQPNPYAGFLGLTLPLAVGLSLGALSDWFVTFKDIARRGDPCGRPVHDQPPRRGESYLAPRARGGGWGWGVYLYALLNRHLPRLAALGLLAALLATALIMSWSRGAWLGVGAAMLVMLLAWPRRAWIGVLLLAGGLVLGLGALQAGLVPTSIAARLTGWLDFTGTTNVIGVDITPANYAVLERLAHWHSAREMARYHFWLGVGFGNYEPTYPGYALINWPQALGHAHNTYLNLLAEVGIIGLVAYIALWASVIWQTWRVTRTSTGLARAVALGLLGVWTHLTVHHFLDKLYVANLFLHLGAMLGVLTILIQREKTLDRHN